jgi:E3 ubiquitin-protein ligase UHRF1
VKLANDKPREHRDECAKAGVHAPPTAGIWGGKKGAYSIVMSGGYGDDVDKGDTMCVTAFCFIVRFISLGDRTYTGTGGYGDDKRYGGNNSSWGSSIQVEDQTFGHKDNEALYVRSSRLANGACLTVLQISWELGKPVRVIRGHDLGSKYAPQAGYRYDGLYKVINVIIPFLLCLTKPRSNASEQAYMDKSKDGVYQICRFDLVVRISLPPT